MIGIMASVGGMGLMEMRCYWSRCCCCCCCCCWGRYRSDITLGSLILYTEHTGHTGLLGLIDNRAYTYIHTFH